MGCAFDDSVDQQAFGLDIELSSTLASMREQVRSRADFDGSFITNAELNDFLNSGGAQLHDFIVGVNEDYILCNTSILVAQNVDSYQLPKNFYKARLVDWSSNTTGSYRQTMEPFALAEKNQYSSVHLLNTAPSGWVRYRIQGNRISFIPLSGGGGVFSGYVGVHYVPQYLKLINDSDRVGSYMPVGHEEYMVLTACAYAREKEQNDATFFWAERDKVEQRIRRIIPDRVQSENAPPTRTRSLTTGRRIIRYRY